MGAFACSAIGFGLQMYANRYLTATVVSMYCIVQPVVTPILSYIIMGELLTFREGISGVLICAGMLVTSMGQPKDLDYANEGSSYVELSQNEMDFGLSDDSVS